MNLDPVPPVALVVDDEPVARLMVKLALQNLGCAPVLEAAEGIAAQELLREHSKVALVLELSGCGYMDSTCLGTAHAALSTLNERNREEFEVVIESLRGERDGPR